MSAIPLTNEHLVRAGSCFNQNREILKMFFPKEWDPSAFLSGVSSPRQRRSAPTDLDCALKFDERGGQSDSRCGK